MPSWLVDLSRRAGPRAFLLALSLILVTAILGIPAQPAQARYAAIIVDADTGQVLYSRNAKSRKYPASLTKLMTLYMLFDAMDAGQFTLQSRLAVSKRAQGMAPSKLGLKRGETISVEQAIYALITKSANDVAVVVAKALGGTEIEFAKMMTEKARALGMSKTTFRNASGLPNRHQKSTATDMAVLAKALLVNHASYYGYFNTQSFKFRGRTYKSHNRLLRDYPGTDGMKTGYIRASGFNLVASVKRNGRRLIGVVFGGRSGKSRDLHMMKLFDRGFASLGRLIAKAPPLPGRNPFHQPPVVVAAQTTETDQSALLIPAPKPLTEEAPLVTHAGPVEPVATAPAAAQASAVLDMRDIITKMNENEAKVALKSVPAYWSVQVGAYSSYAPAQSAATDAARRVPHLLMGARMTISQSSTDKGAIYRAQLTGLNERQARDACAALKSQSQDCLVVAPKSPGTIEYSYNEQ